MSYKTIFLAGLIFGLGNGILWDDVREYKVIDQTLKDKLINKGYKIFINNALGTAIATTGFVYGIETWTKMSFDK